MTKISRSHYSLEDRVTISRYGREYGYRGAVPHLRKLLGTKITHKSIRLHTKRYLCNIQDLPNIGRPKKLGHLDEKVCVLIKHLKSKNSVVTRNTVIGIAKAVIKRSGKSQNLYIIGPAWAKSILNRLELISSRCGPKNPNKPKNLNKFKKEKKTFLDNISNKVFMENDRIPDELVFNVDQIMIEIPDRNSNNKITLVVGISLSGNVLPVQVIFSEYYSPSNCISEFKFPSKWSVTYTKHGSSNLKSMSEYVNKVLSTYIKDIKIRNCISKNKNALLIVDKHTVHQTEFLGSQLKNNKIQTVFVPAGFTTLLQPIDLKNSVGSFLRSNIYHQFQDYYSKIIFPALNENCFVKRNWRPNLNPAYLQIKIAQWIKNSFLQLRKKRNMIKYSWERAHIKNVVKNHSK